MLLKIASQLIPVVEVWFNGRFKYSYILSWKELIYEVLPPVSELDKPVISSSP
jgi:hypothetical protein